MSEQPTIESLRDGLRYLANHYEYAKDRITALEATIARQSAALRMAMEALDDSLCRMTGGQTWGRAHDPSCPKCLALAACREAITNNQP